MVRASVRHAIGCALRDSCPGTGGCTDRVDVGCADLYRPAHKVQFRLHRAKGQPHWLRDTAAGVQTNQLLFTNPTFKYGVSDSSDIQLNWVPFTQVWTRDASGNVASVSGVGDAIVRFKQRLSSIKDDFQLAILPFLRLPTASTGIGNGKIEGGVAVPINYSVPGGWTVTLGPQLDVPADFDGRGRHLGVTGLVNVAKQFGQFTLYNEIWTNQISIQPARCGNTATM